MKIEPMDLLTILVIDDEEDVRVFLKKALERRGYSVITAADGDEGLEKIKQFEIPIVFCDILMPKLNGIDFLREVHNYNLATQVIMVTGSTNLNTCIEAVENGACGYLIKPVNIDDLAELILMAKRNIAEKKGMLRRVIEKLSPDEVDNVLRRILLKKDIRDKKDIIKETLDKKREDK